MKLSDFTVSMDGNFLLYKDWNVDESLSEKRGYYGIKDTIFGLELYFPSTSGSVPSAFR